MSSSFQSGHALLIGSGADLPFTVDDARGIADILKDPERCAYPAEQVELLTGEGARRQAVLDALDRLAKRSDESSTAVVYFSGHGYRASTPIAEAYFLIPFGVDMGRLKDTAISGSEFAAKLQAIRAKKLLLLLDCCHAGGVGLAKGLELAKSPLPPEALQILEAGRGRVIIASCMDSELSYGGKPYSAFTLALIEALSGRGASKQDGFVRAADLALYAREKVPGRTKGRQHPIMHFEEADNFEIAYYAGGEAKPKGLPFEEEPEIEPEPGAWSGVFDQRGQTVQGPQTNIAGSVHGPVFSGQFSGPVAMGGEAIDMRSSIGAIYKPTGRVEQQFGDRIEIRGDGNVIGDGSRSTVFKSATKEMEPPELSDKKEAKQDIERLNLRMDVAVPDNVQIEKVFDLAVSIRGKSSPVLSISGLAHVESGPVLARRHKSQSSIQLQVQISAPDCVIHDSDRQSVLYIIGEDSDPIYFQLTPKKQGAISIVVRLYQEDERLGNTRVHTFASNEAIGRVEVITSSMLVRKTSEIDFLLVAPLPEERDAILRKLAGCKKLPPIEEDIHTYYQSDVTAIFSDNNTGIYHVIVLPLIGMGQVQAATATTTAIDRWGPRYVIVIGIAGGIAEKGVQIGDILIADQIANYEWQKITPEGPEIRWDVHQVDQRLLNACKNFTDDSWSKLVHVDRPDSGEPKRFYGPIASGDKVVAFGDFLEKHHETWPKLIGVEMEAAGAAKAAFQSSTNSGFFMVRCVSDLADENKERGEVRRWRLYACDVAASFAIALLKSGPVPFRMQKP